MFRSRWCVVAMTARVGWWDADCWTFFFPEFVCLFVRDLCVFIASLACAFLSL